MSSRSDFRAGLRDVLPVLLAIMPFGIVYGALAVDAGLSVLEACGLSLTIYAGASQLVALQMVGLGAPLWVVLFALTMVNLRHLLYSASVGRHLGAFSWWQKALAFCFLVDPVFGAAETRVLTHRLSPTYYFAFALALYGGWQVATLIGATLGGFIGDPAALGLDFILPVYFLTMVMEFRHRAGFYPVAAISAVASIAVYALIGPPWHVTLGALAGLGYAALVPPKGRPEDGGAA
ncbi:AzlC family ABC transporter permease [Aurantimonas sp. MSK8Z-1]|uniref:AzlC family ABC transporter permease n=1 Tax=Mangrovibrevibacter kandeliae TaxID=2968473 RepID=UPI002118A82B|nr:AzlC family ABC transporter permease [Aurantimonas sp. MSK8Z-1]MCW4116692.1 AzlC family ABC transporter permease [Aurantimonas sp. MSK8Z-1]